jgi:hypothetical protein
MDWKVRDSSPGEATDSSILLNIQTGLEDHPASYSIYIEGISPRAYEVDNSPASSVRVKSEWTYNSTPHTPSCRALVQIYTFLRTRWHGSVH